MARDINSQLGRDALRTGRFWSTRCGGALRSPKGRNHALAARLSAQERRSLQRKYDPHRILQRDEGAEWRSMVDSYDDCRRSEVSQPALHHEQQFQKRARWFE